MKGSVTPISKPTLSGLCPIVVSQSLFPAPETGSVREPLSESEMLQDYLGRQG